MRRRRQSPNKRDSVKNNITGTVMGTERGRASESQISINIIQRKLRLTGGGHRVSWKLSLISRRRLAKRARVTVGTVENVVVGLFRKRSI